MMHNKDYYFAKAAFWRRAAFVYRYGNQTEKEALNELYDAAEFGMKDWWKGKKQSPKHREKISIALSNYWARIKTTGSN